MRALRARTAAATLSGTPLTGPIVPSGLIIPVDGDVGLELVAAEQRDHRDRHQRARVLARRAGR